MKRYTVLIAALVAVAGLVGLAGMASAGDYHVGRTLVCVDCHTAHASMQHGYGAGYENTDALLTGGKYTGTPNPTLLRGATISNACINCHDGKAGIPDVIQGPTDNLDAGGGRSAGALNVKSGHGVTPDATYPEGDGHTLWSTDTPPGGDGVGSTSNTAKLISDDGLQCTNCHGAHGNKYFRNMMGQPGNSTATYINAAWYGKEVTYQITPLTNPAPAPPDTVWVREGTARNYKNENVMYLQPDTLRSAYGEWCQTCHTDFHGNITTVGNVLDAADEIVRHPTAGARMTDDGTTRSMWAYWSNAPVGGTYARLKVMSTNAAWAATTDPNTKGTAEMLAPSCFTCHKSHGNKNPFGLIFVLGKAPFAGSGTAPLPTDASLLDPTRNMMTEQGTGSGTDNTGVRDLCRNCHGMGSWPRGNPTNIIP